MPCRPIKNLARNTDCPRRCRAGKFRMRTMEGDEVGRQAGPRSGTEPDQVVSFRGSSSRPSARKRQPPASQ